MLKLLVLKSNRQSTRKKDEKSSKKNQREVVRQFACGSYSLNSIQVTLCDGVYHKRTVAQEPGNIKCALKGKLKA